MVIRWMVLFLLYNRTCLSYPTDSHRDNPSEEEFSPKCSKNIASSTWSTENVENFNLEPLPLPAIGSDYTHGQQIPQIEPYVNQLPLNYPNNADQFIRPAYFAHHRPFGKPPSRPPTGIPDDVEVFGPLAPGNPIPPPRPIPNHPNSLDVEELWPINGSPVAFPKIDILERDKNVEMLPVVVERESHMMPQLAENGFYVAPESIRNERPVMFEKNPTILIREPPQLMRVIVENEPAREPPMMMEKINVPMIVENEHSEISAPFMENEPIIIRSSEGEHPKKLMPTMMDREMSVAKPAKYSQTIPYTENEKPKRIEERNLSEFIPIPQVLPERFKRDYDRMMKDNIPAAPIGSSSLLFEGKPFDQYQQQSLLDNEIPAHESTMFEEDIVINNNQNHDLFHTFNNESNEIITTTSLPLPDLETLIQDHNTSTSNVDKISPNEQSWLEVMSTTSQLPNDTLNNQNVITLLGTLDAEIENVNSSNVAASGNETSSDQETNDEITSTIQPVEVSTTLPTTGSSQQQQVITDESITFLMKILDYLSKNKDKLNQEANSPMSEKPFTSNATKILTDQPNTNLHDSHAPSLCTNANEKTPVTCTNNATDHWIYAYNSPTNVQHQLGYPQTLMNGETPLYNPFYSYSPQNYIDYGFPKFFDGVHVDTIVYALPGLKKMQKPESLHNSDQVYQFYNNMKYPTSLQI